MPGLIPIVHGLATLFSILTLGLIAYVIDAIAGFSPDYMNFILFSALWSLLVLLYVGLAPLYFATWFVSAAAVGLEIVTAIFWFAGAVAFASNFGAPRCRGNTWCGSAQAAIAFSFFLWILFTVLAVVDTIAFLKARGRISKNPPAATHVGA